MFHKNVFLLVGSTLFTFFCILIGYQTPMTGAGSLKSIFNQEEGEIRLFLTLVPKVLY